MKNFEASPDDFPTLEELNAENRRLGRVDDLVRLLPDRLAAPEGLRSSVEAVYDDLLLAARRDELDASSALERIRQAELEVDDATVAMHLIGEARHRRTEPTEQSAVTDGDEGQRRVLLVSAQLFGSKYLAEAFAEA